MRPRDTARAVCTDKQFAVWDMVETHGFTVRRAAQLLSIDHTTARQHLTRAQQKIAQRQRLDFPAPAPKSEYTREVEANHSIALRLLIQRDGPTCYLCRRIPPAHELSIDHIIPRQHGGTDEPENLGVACHSCNSTKGANFVSLLLTSRRAVYHPAIA